MCSGAWRWPSGGSAPDPTGASAGERLYLRNCCSVSADGSGWGPVRSPREAPRPPEGEDLHRLIRMKVDFSFLGSASPELSPPVPETTVDERRSAFTGWPGLPPAPSRTGQRQAPPRAWVSADLEQRHWGHWRPFAFRAHPGLVPGDFLLDISRGRKQQ